MKKLILNQIGASIVQGLVIAGVMAGTSLVATRLLTDQKLAQKSAETRDQIEDLHTAIYSFMQNRSNCNATIAGNGITGSLLNATDTTSVPLNNGIYLPNNATPVYRKHNGNIQNTYMNKNVLIDDMKMFYDEPNGIATLRITYERLQSADETKRTKQGYGAKRITKDIKVRIQRNPFVGTQPFESCYAFSEKNEDSMEDGSDINKELCLEMNNNATVTSAGGLATGKQVFLWDDATSTCIPNAKCPDHMIFTGIDSVGDVKCRRLEDWTDMNDYIGTTIGTCGPGKNIKFQVTADRKKVNIVCY